MWHWRKIITCSKQTAPKTRVHFSLQWNGNASGQICGSRFAEIDQRLERLPASPRLASPGLATCTIPETRESVGRLSPQSSDDGPQEERSGQNASSRSVQNRRFQVQLSHSRALWPTKRRHCPAGAVPVHLQPARCSANFSFLTLWTLDFTSFSWNSCNPLSL